MGNIRAEINDIENRKIMDQYNTNQYNNYRNIFKGYRT